MNLEEIFSGFIDSSRIIQDEAQGLYGATTTGFRNKVEGALKPISESEIQKIVTVCRQKNIKLYPLSTGRNWGYSDSMPVADGHVILDLSLMNQIHGYDPELGIITVCPGVTQQDLCDFLHEHGDKHIVSVTGSSPLASIVGNYLERGFGLLPMMDHALSVLNLQAVLGDGSLYQSPLQTLGAFRSAQIFRHGVGPYTDGIFFSLHFLL